MGRRQTGTEHLSKEARTMAQTPEQLRAEAAEIEALADADEKAARAIGFGSDKAVSYRREAKARREQADRLEAEGRLVTSTLNLRIDITHDLSDGNLPDAQTLAMWVAKDLARALRLSIPETTDPQSQQRWPAYTWGRFSRFGVEGGQGVGVYLQSAAISGRKEA